MTIFEKIFGRPKSDEQLLRAQVSVSRSFKDWCKSDVGRYVLGRSEQYKEAVVHKMLEVDPLDTDKIMQLQCRANAVSQFMGWIEEVIAEGEAAEFQLMEPEQ